MKPTGMVKGMYEVRHVPSGKVYVGTSVDLAKQYRYQYTLLRTGKHKSPECQELWNRDGSEAFSFSFSVFDEMSEAETLAKTWIANYRKLGTSLNSERVKFDKPNIGVYRIKFPDGTFYIGSSKDIRGRIAHHKWACANGKSNHPSLMRAYVKNDGVFELDIIETKESDIRITEQKLLELHVGQTNCLNYSKNATSVIDDLWANPEYRERMINGANVRRRSDQGRQNYSEKMKAYWATPEAKAKRMGGGNPFARKVSVNGIVYGSVMDAVRAGVMSDSKLRKQLKDDTITDVFYV